MGVTMRGGDEINGSLFSYIDLEQRIRRDHPGDSGDRKRGIGYAVASLRGALFGDSLVNVAKLAPLQSGARRGHAPGVDKYSPVNPLASKLG
jgi:hypothetical protein